MFVNKRKWSGDNFLSCFVIFQFSKVFFLFSFTRVSYRIVSHRLPLMVTIRIQNTFQLITINIWNLITFITLGGNVGTFTLILHETAFPPSFIERHLSSSLIGPKDYTTLCPLEVIWKTSSLLTHSLSFRPSVSTPWKAFLNRMFLSNASYTFKLSLFRWLWYLL